MGYNRAKIIMTNGFRVLNRMTDFCHSSKIECKDYPVWDNDNWHEQYSDNWGDSHGRV